MSCNTRDFVGGIRVTFDGTGTELSITYIIICESNKKQKNFHLSYDQEKRYVKIDQRHEP